MFKSKKQRAADKAAKKAAAVAKNAAAKKAKINKVVRPEPAKPAKVAPKPVVKPGIGPKVNIHMLANAMIDGTQYETGQELTVSMRLYKQIGTSCVSMAKWRNMQEKGGLSSLRK